MPYTLVLKTAGDVSELEADVRDLLDEHRANWISKTAINGVKIEMYGFNYGGVLLYIQSEEGDTITAKMNGKRIESAAHITFAKFDERFGYFAQLKQDFERGLKKYLMEDD